MPDCMKTQYYIIESDTNTSKNVIGPFASQAKAEAHLAKELPKEWREACGCLRGKDHSDDPWCLPYLIVKAVRRVVPEFTATAILKDV